MDLTTLTQLKLKFTDMNEDKYNDLKTHIDKYKKLINTSKINLTGINTQIPAHLENKYGQSIFIPNKGKKDTLTRIRDIFNKITENNKVEMIKEFHFLKFDKVVIYDQIINTIFTNIIDVIYMFDVNSSILFALKEKNIELFDGVIDCSVNLLLDNYFLDVLESKEKHLKINNSVFFGKLLNLNLLEINEINVVFDHLVKNMNNNDNEITLSYISKIFGSIEKCENDEIRLSFNKILNVLLKEKEKTIPYKKEFIIDTIINFLEKSYVKKD